MKLTSPFAYPAIVALKKNQRIVFPRVGETPEFCRKLQLVPVSFSEFSAASHDYPLLFVSSDKGATFGPMALLGLNQGQNLFLDESGKWDQAVYVPAYVRRYPFCMAKIAATGVTGGDRILCVAEQEIGAGEGELLLDDQGKATPRWAEMDRLLNEYEADLMRTDEMCGILGELKLLEPFVMNSIKASGGKLQLAGMYRLSEARLRALEASQLQMLLNKGMLGRLYAHLLSLDNFPRLLARQTA
ncbi:MAG: SapC family protein [Nitrosomonadales bacterium]|nr:SapC family protein [Nitrosomonadales bacterium]